MNFVTIVKIGLVFILFGTKLRANCAQQVMILKKGETSPCSGFLFSPEKEHQLRLQDITYKHLLEEVEIHLRQKELLKQEVVLSDQLIKKEQEKSELWRNKTIDITQKFTELQEASSARDYLLIGSGVVITAIAAWSIGQTK